MKRLLLIIVATLSTFGFIYADTIVDIDGASYRLTDKNTADFISLLNSDSNDYVIPKSVTYNGQEYLVTSIEIGAFSSTENLISVTIPNSVTSIGKHAFEGCTCLISVNIPNGVTTIDEYVFYGCVSLTSVTLPNSVTLIEEGAFSGCTCLTSVNIPNSVTTIGMGAFENCI